MSDRKCHLPARISSHWSCREFKRKKDKKNPFPSDLRELVACSQVNRFMLFWYAESPAGKLNDRGATRSSLFIIIPVKSDSFLAKFPPRSEDLVNGNTDVGPVGVVPVVLVTESAHFCLLTGAQNELPTDMAAGPCKHIRPLRGTFSWLDRFHW